MLNAQAIHQHCLPASLARCLACFFSPAAKATRSGASASNPSTAAVVDDTPAAEPPTCCVCFEVIDSTQTHLSCNGPEKHRVCRACLPQLCQLSSERPPSDLSTESLRDESYQVRCPLHQHGCASSAFAFDNILAAMLSAPGGSGLPEAVNALVSANGRLSEMLLARNAEEERAERARALFSPLEGVLRKSGTLNARSITPRRCKFIWEGPELRPTLEYSGRKAAGGRKAIDLMDATVVVPRAAWPPSFEVVTADGTAHRFCAPTMDEATGWLARLRETQERQKQALESSQEDRARQSEEAARLLRARFAKADGSYAALMCSRCGFGPVEHHKCGDLKAHHNDINFGSRGGKTNNSCPCCGHFVSHVNGWKPWDGKTVGATGRGDAHNRFDLAPVRVLRVHVPKSRVELALSKVLSKGRPGRAFKLGPAEPSYYPDVPAAHQSEFGDTKAVARRWRPLSGRLSWRLSSTLSQPEQLSIAQLLLRE